jgi:hypothetical protein
VLAHVDDGEVGREEGVAFYAGVEGDEEVGQVLVAEVRKGKDRRGHIVS